MARLSAFAAATLGNMAADYPGNVPERFSRAIREMMRASEGLTDNMAMALAQAMAIVMAVPGLSATPLDRKKACSLWVMQKGM